MRAGVLPSLLRRCTTPKLFQTRSDALEAAKALLVLRTYVSTSERELLQPLAVGFLQTVVDDVTIPIEVFESVPLSPMERTHGAAAALFAFALSKLNCDDATWGELVKMTQLALQAGKWLPSEINSILTHINFWKEYPPSFGEAVERYVQAQVKVASTSELITLFSISKRFVSSQSVSTQSALIKRSMEHMEQFTISQLGSLVKLWCETNLVDANLARTFQNQIARFAEDCSVSDAVSAFSFLVSHDETVLNVSALQCLCEKIVEAAENLELEEQISLLKNIRRLPKLPNFSQDLDALMTFLAEQTVSVLESDPDNGGLNGEDLAVEGAEFVSHFLAACETFLKRTERRKPAVFQSISSKTQSNHNAPPQPATLVIPTAILKAQEACGTFILHYAEELVNVENPSFSLLPLLFEAEVEVTKQAAAAMLKEAADQGAHFPTVQTFQLLLGMSDHGLFHRKTVRHLRKQFATSINGVPMIQLCVALKCLVLAEVTLQKQQQQMDDGQAKMDDEYVDIKKIEEEAEAEVESEEEIEELQQFLTQCYEVISKGISTGMDLRCAISLTESMNFLGYDNPDFFEAMALYLNVKAEVGSAHTHYRSAASNVLSIFTPEVLQKYPKVQPFLDEVSKIGLEIEPQKPSDWLNENDPAHFLLPLTEEQEKGWSILRSMQDTPAHETKRLEKLAAEYNDMLPFHRVDDLKFFFGVFAEKVLKNDALLKKAMDHLVESKTIIKLSGSSIAVILTCLSDIRFSYYGTVKRFMGAISEEQWSTMDASVVAGTVTAMARLSLRLQHILLHIGERVAVIYKLLTPIDVAALINGFQSLGFHEDSVMKLLFGLASSYARRLSEPSLIMLFGSCQIHRLMTSEETAKPLLTALSKCNLSLANRQQFSNNLRRSGLPRELLSETLDKLAAPLPASVSAIAARLEQQKQLQLGENSARPPSLTKRKSNNDEMEEENEDKLEDVGNNPSGVRRTEAEA